MADVTSRPYRVLVLDDETSIRHAVRLMLEDIDVIECASVAEVKDAMEGGGSVDVALIDKNLPDGSGLKIVQYLKRQNPRLTVIVMTAYPSMESAIEAVAVGADDYLLKPFDMHELVLKVRNAAEKSRLLEQLQQAERLELAGLLAGGVAHDLNNLLTVLTSYTGFVRDFLEERSGSPDFAKPLEDVDVLMRSCESAARLTRQLLGISSRRMAVQELVNLNDVVREWRGTVLRSFEDSINLELELSDSAPTVSMDVGECEQLILNLVINARDAMPNGGTVTIRTRRVGTDSNLRSELEVSDQGVGMDAATIQRGLNRSSQRKV